jgi:lactoylglutathione lyase
MDKPIVVRFDHIALHVKDVSASVQFYQNILGLELLPRPKFDFEGAWFLVGDREIHLIGNRIEKPLSGSRSNHFALQVHDLSDWEIWLQHQKYPYRPPKARPDGVRQIFLEDPDGYTIELAEKSSSIFLSTPKS